MITSPKTAAMPVSPSEPPRSVLTMIAPQPAKTRAKVASASARARRGSGGLVKELSDQRLHAFIDLVPDPPDGLEFLTSRVIEFPILYRLPRKTGQASPHPIVMTTSAERTASSVSGFGNSSDMSTPTSFMAATTAGLTSISGRASG